MSDTDPTAPAPWAMQLAARVEKIDPPAVADICAAAALAAIGVIGHDNASLDGPWSEPIDHWQGGGRIRKLVRRARGAAWERAQRPSGVTATVGAAEVRAYVPSQMDVVPDEVAALQIRSTELPAPDRVDAVPKADPSTLMIALTPAVEMSWGKQAAQSAHAGQILWRGTPTDIVRQWESAGRTVVVIHPNEALWHELLNTASAQVRDGGFTEVAPGTLTAASWWSTDRP